MEDIKKSLEQGKLVFGKNIVLKKLKAGQLTKVITSTNCNPDLKQDISDLKEDAILEISNQSSKDLGAMVRKNFGISVIGVLK